MTHAAEVIEIIGSSDKSWQDAAQAALDEAKKTIHEITGVEVGDMTAKVDPNTGNITEYRTMEISIGKKALYARYLNINKLLLLPASVSATKKR
jgi:flavin-binding protein dodecin